MADDDVLIEHAMSGFRAERAGLRLFSNVADVQHWVDEQGGGDVGELALRNALAKAGRVPAVVAGIADEWIAQRERERAAANTREALDLDRTAATAAMTAARYAMWGALVSAATALASAAAAYFNSR
jgi:hypothetical protein